jgi:N-acetylneuraminic acid mutarotase
VRVSGQLVVSDGVLYLVGGMQLLASNSFYPDRRVYRYQPREDRWFEVAPFPDLRDGAAVGVPGGMVVVGGGFGDPEHGGTFPGDSAVVYDASANAWRYTAPIRTPRHRPLAVASGSIVYVFGGLNLNGIGTPLDIEIYDATSNTWRISGEFVDYGQIVGQAHAHAGNAVHFFGGLYAQPGSPVIETHFRYDLATEQWQVLPELPTPRAHAAAVVLDGRIYVLGGLRGPRLIAESFTPVVEVFDVR